MRTSLAQTFMRNTLEELTVAFHDTPLNEDHGGGSGPKPGERVPDGDAVRASDGQTVSVNELTRGTGWTLLLFGGTAHPDRAAGLAAVAEAVRHGWAGLVDAFHVLAAVAPPDGPPAPAAVLMDPCGELHGRFGVHDPAVYLLRPDGCVGFRGRAADGDRLLNYLRRVFA